MTSASHPIFALAEISDSLQDLMQILGVYEFAPHPDFLHWLGHQVCNPDSALIEVCDNIAFAMFGLNPAQFNQ